MPEFPTVNFSETGQGLFSAAQILRLMRNECDRARRYGYPVTVMRLGVDRLEQLGDLYGFESRSAILGEVERVLRSVTRESDVLGCMVDGHFLALFPHTSGGTGARLAERLLGASRKLAFNEGMAEVHVTVSLGLAEREPGGETTYDELVRRSRAALDQAIAAGGNRFQRYVPRPSAEAQGRAKSGDPRDIGAELDRMLGERMREVFASMGVELPDFGGQEQEVLQLAARKLQEARAREAARHRGQIDVLERRLGKLAEALQVTEGELRRALAVKGLDPGMASVYRTVQGLGSGETDLELKREMMEKIFEANLELRRKRQERGRPA